MLVGVVTLPPSFPPSGTFFFINKLPIPNILMASVEDIFYASHYMHGLKVSRIEMSSIKVKRQTLPEIRVTPRLLER